MPIVIKHARVTATLQRVESNKRRVVLAGPEEDDQSDEMLDDDTDSEGEEGEVNHFDTLPAESPEEAERTLKVYDLISAFLSVVPAPTDAQVQALAEAADIQPKEFESVMYKLMSAILHAEEAEGEDLQQDLKERLSEHLSPDEMDDIEDEALDTVDEATNDGDPDAEDDEDGDSSKSKETASSEDLFFDGLDPAGELDDPSTSGPEEPTQEDPLDEDDEDGFGFLDGGSAQANLVEASDPLGRAAENDGAPDMEQFLQEEDPLKVGMEHDGAPDEQQLLDEYDA